MFEKLKELYLRGRISIAELEKAVEKKWISKAEKEAIING